VAQRENEIRTNNQMTYTNIKSYTFLCGRFDDFLFRPSLPSQIKVELHNYWKKENVYVSAEYREGEEIRVIVYEDGQRVLLDQQYYMTTGFSFAARGGSDYVVRFLAAGTVGKLVSMITSSPLQISAEVATKEHIEGAQGKVEKMGHELKVGLGLCRRCSPSRRGTS
jgi:hypothetical protein